LAPGAGQAGAQAGARPRVIPGGFRPTTRTVEQLKGITPGAEETLRARFGEGGTFHEVTKALQTENDYRALMMEESVRMNEQKTQILEDRNLARQDLDDRRKAATNEFMSNYQQTLQETNAMKIDDYWADKSTGTKVLAAIAVGLGAFAREQRGGSNTAMQIINDAIQRDLVVQKANLAKGRVRLEDMRGGYALIRQQFDDEILADQIYYAGALDQVQGKIDTLMANAKTDEMLNAGHTLSAQRADMANETLQNIMLRGEMNVKEEHKYRGPKVVGGAQAGVGADYNPKLWVPAFAGNARGAENFKKLSNWAADMDKLDGMWKKMIDYRDSWANMTNADKRARVQEIQKMATKHNAAVEGAGASLTDSEIAMVSVSDVDEIGSLLATARLEARREQIKDDYRTKGSHLIRKVDPTTVPRDELDLSYRLQGQRTGASGLERPVGGE
jgi:hypothetical protein